MTVKEYFTSKNEILGIEMTSNQLDAFIISVGLDKSASLDSLSENPDVSYVGVVLTLLVRPNIAEDNYSISYDRNAILNWYRYETGRLGIPNEIEESKAIVRDKSYLA